MIALNQVALTLGGRRIFENLSWGLHRGQRFGLVGPNGAGKSTLLKLMSGVIESDSGRIEKSEHLKVGYLPQEVPIDEMGTPWEVTTSVFRTLQSLESRISQLSAQLPDASRTEQSRMAQEIDELQMEWENGGGYSYEVRVGTILTGLGIHETKFHEPLSAFSGGWRARVYLARLLLSEPDVFLLDEPTNHLDLDALQWLAQFLLDKKTTLIVVSHDRWFLNTMCTHIAELSEQGLYVSKGNFDHYLANLDERARQIDAMTKKHAAQVSRLSKFVERFGAKATKARQAKSKLKQLDRLGETQERRQAQSVYFSLPPAAPVDRVVLSMSDVSFSYNQDIIFKNVSAVITKGARIGVVGPNGVGKSTLLSLISGALLPTSGTITLSERIRLFLFKQHQIDALDARMTAIECVESTSAKSVTSTQIRSALGAFGLSGEDGFKVVEVLSGGEKARVALTKALMQPVNLILLDEPTNHLDMASKQILEDALVAYDGTLIVISHDRKFLNEVCTEIWSLERGTMHSYLGNYEDYLQKRKAVVNPHSSDANDTAGVKRSSAKSQKARRKQDAEKRKADRQLLKPLQKLVDEIELNIGIVEDKLSSLEAEQLKAGHHLDVTRMVEVAKGIAELSEEQERLYRDYGCSLEALERAKATLV